MHDHMLYVKKTSWKLKKYLRFVGDKDFQDLVFSQKTRSGYFQGDPYPDQAH
jgi:hypothetical protein